MEDHKPTINKGFVKIKGEGDDRRYDFLEEDIELFHNVLCENHICIPELNIDGHISWIGCGLSFGLDRHSVELLTNSGRNMYIKVSGSNCSERVTEGVRFEFTSIGYGYAEVEFTLLDEYKRDFSLNPIYNEPFNISRESMTQIFQLDFGKLFLNPAHSDITFQCKDGSLLKAHKLILIARCNFFERMFAYNTVESTALVQCGFKSDIMKAVLEYIYNGNFSGGNVYELYEAADYYDIHPLKMMCVKLLYQQITSSNVITVLRYAESMSSSELKRRALIWITWNAKYVKESDEYSNLIKLASSSRQSNKLLKSVEEAFEEFYETTKDSDDSDKDD